MQFYWLRERQEQQQFKIKWMSGQQNPADYFTKHHPGAHHHKVRPIYLYEGIQSPTTLQGCIEILTRDKPHTTQTNARSGPVCTIPETSLPAGKRRPVIQGNIGKIPKALSATKQKRWSLTSNLPSPHYLSRTFI